jgi:hypothetical protein
VPHAQTLLAERFAREDQFVAGSRVGSTDEGKLIRASQKPSVHGIFLLAATGANIIGSIFFLLRAFISVMRLSGSPENWEELFPERLRSV